MMPLGISHAGAIGVDIGTRSVKAIQLTRGLRGWSIRAAARFPRPQTDAPWSAAEAARIRAVLDRQGFGGSAVVLATPPDRLLSGVLELPPRRSGAPLAQIARMELARMHSRTPTSFEMSCWDLPDSPGKKDQSYVMAVACGHEEAEQLVGEFERGGLVIQAMDVRCCALGRACASAAAPAGQVTAILEIGWQTTHLVLVQHDVILYEREMLDGGIGKLAAALEKRFGFDAQTVEYLLDYEAIAPHKPQERRRSGPLDEVRAAVEKYLEQLADGLTAPLAYVRQLYPG